MAWRSPGVSCPCPFMAFPSRERAWRRDRGVRPGGRSGAASPLVECSEGSLGLLPAVHRRDGPTSHGFSELLSGSGDPQLLVTVASPPSSLETFLLGSGGRGRPALPRETGLLARGPPCSLPVCPSGGLKLQPLQMGGGGCVPLGVIQGLPLPFYFPWRNRGSHHPWFWVKGESFFFFFAASRSLRPLTSPTNQEAPGSHKASAPRSNQNRNPPKRRYKVRQHLFALRGFPNP
ncbi:uncharacterized protein LOC134292937 [Anolis carolinensis]|uniref:uncharacterized protein LOC134292937 n=1 Tax=Anolis carolinensis TaxID=28377 RepID=UPI002F2B6CF3